MISATLVVLVALVLQIGLSAGELKIEPRHCEKLCGIKKNISSTYHPSLPLQFDPFLLKFPSEKETCSLKTPEIESWANSSRRFLAYIGMNVSAHACLRLHDAVPTPNQRNILRNVPSFYFRERLDDIFDLESYNTFSKLPKDIQGSCEARVDRGVLKLKNLSELEDYTTDWLVAHKYGTYHENGVTSPLGWLFAFFADTSGKARSITLPNETVPYSLFWFNNKHQSNEMRYSMFVDWKFDQIPRISKLLERLGDAVNKLKDMDNDVSPSNIAILSLPLLMAIPPVSLLESVSDTATMWYVFATDILATVPLLIKGIELLVEQNKAETDSFISLTLIGERYGVSERWYVACQPKEAVRRVKIGAGLVATALYFMVASMYAEFLFWRAMKYRQGRLQKMDTNDVEGLVLDENHVNRNNTGLYSEYSEFLYWQAKKRHEDCLEEESASDADGIVMEDGNTNENSLYAKFMSWRAMRYRKRHLKNMELDDTMGTQTDEENADKIVGTDSGSKTFRLSRSIIRKVLVGLLTICSIVTFVYSLEQNGVAIIALPILLVLLGAVATKRLVQFLRWRFWVGLVFGFVGGPIYLLLHVRKKVRKSESWGEVSEGANIGFSILILTLTLLLPLIYGLRSLQYKSVGVTSFPMSLCCLLFVVNLIRSTSEDRVGWRYGAHGFMSGFVFGPFALLFSRCFPEMKRKERAHFFVGFAYGLVFLVCVSTLTLFFVNAFINSKRSVFSTRYEVTLRSYDV